MKYRLQTDKKKAVRPFAVLSIAFMSKYSATFLKVQNFKG